MLKATARILLIKRSNEPPKIQLQITKILDTINTVMNKINIGFLLSNLLCSIAYFFTNGSCCFFFVCIAIEIAITDIKDTHQCIFEFFRLFSVSFPNMLSHSFSSSNFFLCVILAVFPALASRVLCDIYLKIDRFLNCGVLYGASCIKARNSFENCLLYACLSPFLLAQTCDQYLHAVGK